ncbi:hypothetical protein [Martelella soudanensis]|uniref:hypothetical protein n=1 Tax=unclassified Martelella TaxID=2629616 RepID=UPI0015DDBDBE|nr:MULTISPECIES: hypothetical protein [unclassified Martelella]
MTNRIIKTGMNVDEAAIEELGPEELQGANGGSFFGSVWNGIQDGAELTNDVEKEVMVTLPTEVVDGASSGAKWVGGEAVKAASTAAGDVENTAKTVWNKLS